MTFAVKFTANKYKHLTLRFHGSVAQWIRRLPTEQEIVGSSPAWVNPFWFRFFIKNLNDIIQAIDDSSFIWADFGKSKE